VVFDGDGRFVTAVLRPGKRPSGQEVGGFVRRLVGAIRARRPKVEILLRADSHYAGPQVFDWCHANRVDWVFGPTSASPSNIQGGSRIRECRTFGSVRGVLSNGHPLYVAA